MFRPAVRALARAPVAAPCGPASRRLISTGPTKSRSWKNTVIRLGLAGGAIYYYNTSSAFSKEPSFSILATQKENGNGTTETLDSITPKIRAEREAAARSQPKPQSANLEGGVNPEQLEEEAGQEAAFNPETGEINWDCPCLGGMAHGPCGEEFKAAFSCFVYSQEEPKGIDCIEKFQGMQNCFRAHPDVYGAELEDEEAEGAAPAEQPTAADIDAASHPEEKRARAKDAKTQVKADNVEKGEHAESEALVPKAAHDAEQKNQEVSK
ncbi:hypothetical protein N7532_006334 [Penicillium argentinense]|uniref:Mitochondrial intermembrane space import and assembly protein 40 n=1 Tax=Penicillium argentinense TaxID=1131581 RepID=A0A9W9FFM6_9EURO|nr:uncharacterized protein N7532_006334 [Penicillium argentinense]KAJ5099333.1 hypothetical protein N7532_006334 [Penicillium argentinense]